MKLPLIVAAALTAVLVTPGVAAAQTEPVEGGTTPIGYVPNFLELILPQSGTGFASFAKAKDYEMSIDAQVTTTGPAQLSVADGDATSTAARGHLSVGAKRLPSPLEATVGKTAFQSLDGSVDPFLTKWADATTRTKARVKLRQKVTGKATGSYRKLVLVTLSSETP